MPAFGYRNLSNIPYTALYTDQQVTNRIPHTLKSEFKPKENNDMSNHTLKVDSLSCPTTVTPTPSFDVISH